MIYLDNASTTNKKPLSVKMAVLKSLTKKYCANPGRSSHLPSLQAGNIVFETRMLVKEFVNADCVENVIFTSGCTEALNIAILGTVKVGGHVVISGNEHNSVARPLMQLSERGLITLTILENESNRTVSATQIENAITDKTYLVIVNHTSNVTGATANITEIGSVCKKNNVLLLVDCAQSAGHYKIDMQKDNIDMLAIAGHKGLYATQGIGALVFKNGIEILPMKFGGTGTDSENLMPPITYPESLEAGTSPTPAIFSLNAGIKYVNKHFNKINSKINNLTSLLISKLKEFPEVVIYSPENTCGVISIRVKNTDTSNLVNYFNSNKICVRGGLHCAPLCHKNLNTLDGGTLRISISHFNTKKHINKFVSLLEKFINELQN